MGEMGCRLDRPVKVLPSLCDGDSKLSIPAAFDLFQNTATLHADHFDIGPEGMERRNYFWVITKTRMHFNKMPEMMDDVVFSTWIQAAERASCERDFSMTADDETLLYGRSIWAVISRDTGRLVHMDTLYPVIDFEVPPPDDKPWVRMSKDFSEAETIGEYTVRSIDIDLGGHMNNVNYVRAMLGCFTTEELAGMDISEIEVNYVSQTREGETLTFRRREKDGATEIGALSPDGKTMFMAHIN